MSKISFQDNFGTNLTSAQIAGVTTTPLDSIPSVDAPYYLAFDATNVNGKFEIVYVTSDTATNVNHAATSYAHTTAEEVRLVVPSAFLNAIQELEEGGMRNGKISVSVASNNLTVALKTAAGTDASVSDPIFVKIGGTLRTITAALTHTINAGSSWLNMGSAELATKEVDLFVYLVYETTAGQEGVKLLLSRFPGASDTSQFSNSTTLEKGVLWNGNTLQVVSLTCEVVGRFATTLSAGAEYTWTVPTFTAKNLIQRPIYETRWLNWTPALDGGTMTISSITGSYNYKIRHDSVQLIYRATFTTGGTATGAITSTAPFASAVTVSPLSGAVGDTGPISAVHYISTSTITSTRYDAANFGLGASRDIYANGIYSI